MIDYAIEVVGGKHDGIKGLHWSDDGDHPPPDRIIVGTCPGDGACGGDNGEWCRQAGALVRAANGRGGYATAPHPAFWTMEEGIEPPDAIKYRLTHLAEREGRLAAVYVQAGVTRRDPRAVSEERPLTVADILREAPPMPVTALAKALAAGRGLGLSPTSGAARRGQLLHAIFGAAAGSDHLMHHDPKHLWESEFYNGGGGRSER